VNDENESYARISRCVNGRNGVSTRGYGINEMCVEALREQSSARYPKGICATPYRVQAERVAQARFILKSAGVLATPKTPIPASWQWEVHAARIPKIDPDGSTSWHTGRADAIRYDRLGSPASSNPVEVWEVKGVWNMTAGEVSSGSFTSPLSQVDQYIRTFRDDYGWSSARRGNPGHTDWFSIETGEKCSDGTARAIEYSVTAPVPGLVLVTDQPAKPCRDETQKEAQEVQEKAIADEQNQVTSDSSPDLASLPTGTLTPEQVTAGIDELARVSTAVKRALQTAHRTNRTLNHIRHIQFCNLVNHVTPRSAGDGSYGKTGLACLNANNMSELVRSAWFLPVLQHLLDQEWLTPEELLDLFDPDRDDPPGSVPAQVVGDPHLITFDGLNYDLQSVGEFVFVENPEQGLHIQSRFTAWTSSVSVPRAMAMSLDGHRVELRDDRSALIDGTTVLSAVGDNLLTDSGAAVVRRANDTIVVWPDGNGSHSVLSWTTNAAGGSMSLALSETAKAGVAGLLGDANGDPYDDLRLRDGRRLRSDVDAQVLHDLYADSWRVTPEESLFTYAAGQSTATFTDRSYPRDIITRGDFSEEEQLRAAQVCEEWGVQPGPTFSNCELDVMATGNWAFAASIADVSIPSVGREDARFPGVDQSLTVDFESELPVNFEPLRISRDPATTTVAGPFSGAEKYRFYTSDLPVHDRLTIEFDLLGMGTWPGDEDVRLTIDGTVTKVAPDWLDARTGTLATGTPFRSARVSVSLTHYSPRFAADLGAVGLSSLNSQGFAIDNLEISVRHVPPQVFGVDPTAGVVEVSEGKPAPGAGDLETVVSVDEYVFSLDHESRIAVDVTAGITYDSFRTLAWQILDADGQPVHDASWIAPWYTLTAADLHVDRVLPPGDYRLRVSSPHQPASGTYSLRIYVPPPDEVFDITLSETTPLLLSSVAPGAGVLETRLSRDIFRFTLDQPTDLVWDQSTWTTDLTFSLVGSDGEVARDTMQIERKFTSLPAGDYSLTFESSPHRAPTNNGAWAYSPGRLLITPGAQVFEIHPSAGIVEVANGKPAPGAGNLETGVSVDEYPFSLDHESRVLVDVTAGITFDSFRTLAWQVLDAEDQVVDEASWLEPWHILTASELHFDRTLAPGDYRLRVFSPYQFPGTYSLRIYTPPADEIYDITLNDITALTLSSVATGAGVLETRLSRDVFRFTLDVPADLVWRASANAQIRYTLIGPAGEVAAGSPEAQRVFDGLPPGDYALVLEASEARPATNNGSSSYTAGSLLLATPAAPGS
jgi:hypothetical protein